MSKSIYSKYFFLIHGPFGTGKTRTIIEIIRQELKCSSKVLVTAESNKAIDNIVERLSNLDLNITRIGNYKRVSNNIKKYTLDSKFKEHEKYDMIIKNNEEIDKIKKNLGNNTSKSVKLYEENKKLTYEIKMDIIEESQVILGTNSSVISEVLDDITFNLVIIDEASQTTIPRVLLPISKAQKFILVGDHKQLPPTVKCKEASNLNESLFEKLIERYDNQSQILGIQYRMNNKLMEFPNSCFYGNKLKSNNRTKNIQLNYVRNSMDLNSPFIFIDTSQKENNEEKRCSDCSYYNCLEKEIVLNIIKEYLNNGISKKDIGIITQYNAQVDLIKKDTDVEVGTVDSFQGKEKEIIIISNVRSNKEGKVGFLNEKRRLNVALTRAKKKLIIIGNINTLQNDSNYKKLIDFCSKENIIIKC